MYGRNKVSGKDDATFPKHITPVKSREQGVKELYQESGEDWELSSDFVKYIFGAKKLPSHKFFRGRNNVNW